MRLKRVLPIVCLLAVAGAAAAVAGVSGDDTSRAKKAAPTGGQTSPGVKDPVPAEAVWATNMIRLSDAREVRQTIKVTKAAWGYEWGMIPSVKNAHLTLFLKSGDPAATAEGLPGKSISFQGSTLRNPDGTSTPGPVGMDGAFCKTIVNSPARACKQAYNWKVGNSYTLIVKGEPADATGEWWAASIVDDATGKVTPLGRIAYPADSAGDAITLTSQQVLYSGYPKPTRECSQYDKASATWTTPRAFDGAGKPIAATPYRSASTEAACVGAVVKTTGSNTVTSLGTNTKPVTGTPVVAKFSGLVRVCNTASQGMLPLFGPSNQKTLASGARVPRNPSKPTTRIGPDALVNVSGIARSDYNSVLIAGNYIAPRAKQCKW